MDERSTKMQDAALWSGLLGYLNFSAGKPDRRFELQLDQVFRSMAAQNEEEPWQQLGRLLRANLTVLHAAGAGAFQDIAQADAVLALVYGSVLPAYRRHHSDLLFHQTDRDLFQPLFLARVFEAVLAQGSPWDDKDRIVRGALGLLDDYVGHRPIAILESRPKGEPYDHERVRPIPLYFKGVGVACGPYETLVSKALEILRATSRDILADAFFDPELLDELAYDPRAYDHGHPNDKRPNYRFGEWDPHLIDNQGRYRRYVARQLTLDALLDRITHARDVAREEILFESAAVLAGTVLMGCGTSGAGPGTHDSTVKLATIVERVARYRDTFYKDLLCRVGGPHAERLSEEAKRTRQPFGAARQHLNQYIAQHRALQLQQRHLALLFAAIGFADAGRAQAARIPSASVRLLCEILARLTASHLLIDRGKLSDAATLLPEINDLVHRGIQCGALADPWNVLGFQGQYPLFQTIEDSMHDPRIEELLQVMLHFFVLYARLMSEAAATGDKALRQKLRPDLRKLAAWWDRFATYEVSGVLRVHGGEAADSAEHVAAALAKWHERGAAAADLAFWRQHLEGFTSPKAFALVIDALLRKNDYRAAMALLMNWLSQAEHLALEEGDSSFNVLALRWMLGVCGPGPAAGNQPSGITGNTSSGGEAPFAPVTPRSDSPALDTWAMQCKFFDHLEANAEEFWNVPEFEIARDSDVEHNEDEDDTYAAAYEHVTYRDSAEDGTEGSLVEGGSPTPAAEFDLEAQGPPLLKRLNFLAIVGRLWQVAVRAMLVNDGWLGTVQQPAPAAAFDGWHKDARAKVHRLERLIDSLEAYPVPKPAGSADVFVEYERRRTLKAQLLDAAMGACLQLALAVRSLRGALDLLAKAASPSVDLPELLPPPTIVLDKDSSLARTSEPDRSPAPPSNWEPLATQLERALFQARADEVRMLLPKFVEQFRTEPLLYRPLEDGGHPRGILRTRKAQATLGVLVEGLPRLGLLREAFQLLQTARVMEQNGPGEGKRVTEFDRLFQPAFQAVVETVVESAATWDPGAPELDAATLVSMLEELTKAFHRLWVAHSQSMRVSVLETINSPENVEGLYQFIQRYGHDLFRAKFMILANLRGILTSGAELYLNHLAAEPDPLHPVKLIDELGAQITKDKAVRYLDFIIHAVVENYEEYKDYNNTTTHSDYGENLYVLLDFLQLKASYERHAWISRPWVMAHEVLVRTGRRDAARLWQETLERETAEVARRHLEELARKEQQHATRLRTITNRLEERFVQPLALDRLCALVEPAMEEARQGGPGPNFQQLLEALHPYASQPTGVGLDVPSWLRKLEWEAHRVRAGRTAIAGLSQNLFRLPRIQLTLQALRDQVQHWDEPLW